MNYLTISCSLNPDSRSRMLAESITSRLEGAGCAVDRLDLREVDVPFCDGSAAYESPVTKDLARRVEQADGILMAVPIYNFDINAAAKNLIELTGRAWTEKVVAFACAAGGQGSYMSVMPVANSLMLDFRCHIVPRFVYATGEAFKGDEIEDVDLHERLGRLADELQRVTAALRKGG